MFSLVAQICNLRYFLLDAGCNAHVAAFAVRADVFLSTFWTSYKEVKYRTEARNEDHDDHPRDFFAVAQTFISDGVNEHP